MTTIATDGRSMAGDGQSMSRNGLILDSCKAKVRRLRDGRLLGHAGNAHDTDALEQWLNEGGDFPDFDKECFAALILNLDGTLTSLGWNGRTCPADVPAAVGSGEEIAMGAMAAGASAELAVEICCRLDIRTGGQVTALSLDEPT